MQPVGVGGAEASRQGILKRDWRLSRGLGASRSEAGVRAQGRGVEAAPLLMGA